MKHKINLGLIALLMVFGCASLTSCLKHDLPTYPLWNGNEITNVYIEVRYNTDQTYNGQPVVGNQRLTVAKTIDSASSTITLDITVPSATGSFTDSIRNLVSQSQLWPYFDLSTAATMQPDGANTPKPGNVTDFTQPHSYIVTAANGQQRTWTIKVNSLTR